MKRSIIAGLLLSFVTWLAAGVSGVPPAAATHVASHQCGVHSSSFARTCRPSAHTSCLGAANRGVKGFTKELCEKRKAACTKCLGDIHACISRIGHWPALTHSCDKCKARFNTCYALWYPKA